MLSYDRINNLAVFVCVCRTGAVNFTGDHPVVLTVDGPSLGGFVCPTTITSTEVWKVGQVRPGDGVVFRRLSLADAHAALLATDARIAAIREVARENVAEEATIVTKVCIHTHTYFLV